MAYRRCTDGSQTPRGEAGHGDLPPDSMCPARAIRMRTTLLVDCND